MSEITREQRDQWRAEAEDWLGTYRLDDLSYNQARILALLDALAAAEDEALARAGRDQRRYDCVAEALHKAVLRAESAETALRDMEIERNMLRITTRELTEALEAGDACGAVGCRAFARAESAEAALARVKEARSRIGFIRTPLDNLDGMPPSLAFHAGIKAAADLLAAALAGPSPTDEGGEGA